MASIIWKLFLIITLILASSNVHARISHSIYIHGMKSAEINNVNTIAQPPSTQNDEDGMKNNTATNNTIIAAPPPAKNEDGVWNGNF
ncbi:hypothetical protein IC582_017195 [Cucumis melo]|uniref:Uncharacterized protein n=2 Tax=Cucumis melo TaxID=3656 RepID=A0A5D3D0C9_CUCMM|nr:hypothetical protein E6C27_scaffold46G003950 [Cucumis melo var. makuwa]TYK16948.1 hypothetical protein E5676_scaffold130G00850 [Cucumis melo var. makuwa]